MGNTADRLGYGAYRVVKSLFFILPRPLCLALGGGLGRLAFRLDGRHRKIALANLAIAFGSERAPEDLSGIARKSFRHFGRVFADILKLTHYSRSRVRRLIVTEGRENMENALARKTGVLMFTAHFGNWEVAAVPLTDIGPLQVIARALDNPYIERDLARLRSKFGSGLINKIGATRPILQALGRNEIVAILIDQNVLRREAVFVDFFGRTAGTTPGLAAFHVRTGAPLVPIFCQPIPGGRYRLTIRPAVEVPLSGRRDEDVLKITQICTKMIEHEIRDSPELWLWVHKRWNTRPAEEVQT